MNVHTEDQFSVCTLEEEEFFQSMDTKKVREESQQRLEVEKAVLAAQAMNAITYPAFLAGNLCPSQFGDITYQAIKEGKIPGVVLGEPHGS